MPGFYAILDIDACAVRGLAPLAVAAGLLRSGPQILQLRGKGLNARETLKLLRALRAMTPPTIWLFANDRPDLALLAGCDGVHLGQSDLPVDRARCFAPQLKFGISSHDLPQLRSALRQRPDYVAFGPVFKTGSKRNPEPRVGTPLLSAAHAECREARIPLVAIGGITQARAAGVARSSDFVAAIGALLPAPSLAVSSGADPTWVEEQSYSLARAYESALRSA